MKKNREELNMASIAGSKGGIRKDKEVDMASCAGSKGGIRRPPTKKGGKQSNQK